MGLTPYSTFEVPVPGGNLHVGQWGEGDRVVVGAHGLIGNHRSWQAVARQLPEGIRFITPDLRGRGRSARLPGPHGMRTHADDLAAVLDDQGIDAAALVGYSMGGTVATVAATRHPARWSCVVLVDGGIAPPVPEGVDPDDLVAGVLGPALARLAMTFETREHHLDYWRQHPSFLDPGAWNEDTEAWLDYDLEGDEPALRSSAQLDAVRFDSRELLVDPEVRRAAMELTQPAVFLRASRGMLNQLPPLYPDELLDGLRARWPFRLEMHVENTNHYSILLSSRGATAVAAHIAAGFR